MNFNLRAASAIGWILLSGACGDSDVAEVRQEQAANQAPAPASDDADGDADGAIGQYRVTVDSLQRKSCPAGKCGTIARTTLGQVVTVYEFRSGWARVSEYFGAACIDGQSRYIVDGPTACERSNGIDDDGIVAEWVDRDGLEPAPG